MLRLHNSACYSRFNNSQQLMTTLVCCIEHHKYTVVPAIACPILYLSLQVAHIWVQILHGCMHTCTSLASQTTVDLEIFV